MPLPEGQDDLFLLFSHTQFPRYFPITYPTSAFPFPTSVVNSDYEQQQFKVREFAVDRRIDYCKLLLIFCFGIRSASFHGGFKLKSLL